MIWRLDGWPGHGAEQPLAPGAGLLEVAGDQQRVERERGVAEPAVAVVPVPHPADPLGQRRGRRGHDPAGRRVGQRLQRDQRAQDRLAPSAPAVDCSRSDHSRHQRSVSSSACVGVELGRRARSCEGYQVRSNGTRWPSATVKSATVVRSSPRSSTSVRSRSMSGPAIAEIPPSWLPDPGDDRAVVEPDDQLHPHRHLARAGPRRSGRGRRRRCRRHEVDHRDGAGVGLELGLQHERPVPIAPPDPSGPRPPGRSASGRARASPAARRSRPPSRTGGGRASRSTRRARPGRPSGSRRSGRSLRSASAMALGSSG